MRVTASCSVLQGLGQPRRAAADAAHVWPARGYAAQSRTRQQPVARAARARREGQGRACLLPSAAEPAAL